MSERMRSERGARSQREIWQREEKLAQSPREFLGETALSSRPASPRLHARSNDKSRSLHQESGLLEFRENARPAGD